MYQMVDGTACVRLLSIQGEVGCAGPNRKAIHAPLWYLSDASFWLSRKTTIVMPLLVLHDFQNRTINEPSLAKHVASVLVKSDVGEQNATIFSPDAKFPQAEFAYQSLQS
ncbi:hypothetical protein R1flu_028153 [Riccia fluitans]|uniref:Nicastrin n=1 Tax=Riccia fluitans TaxID=41844 RepID=A0ABD1XLD2_9MARC